MRRLIIAGSRHLDEAAALDAIESVAKPEHVSEVVSGGARGADAAGERWAERHSIPVRRFPADWSQGRAAGPKRNEEMAAYGQALLALWDYQSRGTADMIRRARAHGLPVRIVRSWPQDAPRRVRPLSTP